VKKLLFFILFVLVITWTGTAPAHNNNPANVCDSERGSARQICREYCLECASSSQHQSSRKTGGGHHDDDDDDGGGGGGGHHDDDDDDNGGSNCDDDDDDGHHSSRKTGGGHHGDDDDDDGGGGNHGDDDDDDGGGGGGGNHGDDDDDDGGGGGGGNHGDDDDNGDHDDDDGGDCNNNSECDRLKRKFERLTGRQLVCQVPPPTPVCPCVNAFPLFAQLINTTNSPVQQCIATNEVVSVITPAGSFAFVNNGVVPPYCALNNAPPFLSLTAAEAQTCRNALIQAATNRGVPCLPPE
jgi:hypothetical protein